MADLPSSECRLLQDMALRLEVNCKFSAVLSYASSAEQEIQSTSLLARKRRRRSRPACIRKMFLNCVDCAFAQGAYHGRSETTCFGKEHAMSKRSLFSAQEWQVL